VFHKSGKFLEELINYKFWKEYIEVINLFVTGFKECFSLETMHI
jgi:hypothetical protein